jgi:glycerol-3-phosphate dehydrogenase
LKIYIKNKDKKRVFGYIKINIRFLNVNGIHQMKNFSVQKRSSNIKQLSDETFDIVIVGGGITGAGVARDAASRGMKVALVEAQDFAEGTSSRSSKLIHGGIRYLENLELHLVFEALSERNLLFEIAPHLVHPLRFLLPVYKGGRVPIWQMAMGMWLYDILALFQAPKMHEYLNTEDVLDQFPYLQRKGLDGGFIYSDAAMDDDRLTIETLRSANDLGAICVNHVKATKLEHSEGLCVLKCEDQAQPGSLEIKAKHVVSAVGPWTDVFGEHLLKSKWKKVMRPSKGIHLTFTTDRVPLEKAIVMGAEERIVFAIPRNDMVVVGTTDTDYKQNPDSVHSDEGDVQYVLGVINDYFPGLGLQESDIVSSYSGVRPLVHDGSESEGKTSREHTVFQPEPFITFVSGGKYTTYRKMALDVVEQALESYSSKDRVEFKNSQTRQPLNPKVTVDSQLICELQKRSWCKEFNVDLKSVEHFVFRYGFEARDLLVINQKYLNLDKSSIWATEADFAIENTMCMGLVDFYIRRTPLFLSKKDHGFEFLESITNVFAEKLGWSKEEQAAQQNALRQHLQKEMGWRK